jgi:hypothetical protein
VAAALHVSKQKNRSVKLGFLIMRVAHPIPRSSHQRPPPSISESLVVIRLHLALSAASTRIRSDPMDLAEHPKDGN